MVRSAPMYRALVVVLAALVASPACKSSESASPSTGVVDGSGGATQSERVPLVPKDHGLYARFEGTSFKNSCSGDADCFKGGCSSEVCSAANDIAGTCEALDIQIPASASCGCVAGECIWWSDGSASLETARDNLDAPSEQPGGRCGEATCAEGETCIEYYGVAGPRGPKFQTCGIPCPSGKCPAGKKCVTIADGPGPVCQ